MGFVGVFGLGLVGVFKIIFWIVFLGLVGVFVMFFFRWVLLFINVNVFLNVGFGLLKLCFFER